VPLSFLATGGLMASAGHEPLFLALGRLDRAGAVVLWTLVKNRPA
jgi:MFS transporter, ACS family, hexuronate transporter